MNSLGGSKVYVQPLSLSLYKVLVEIKDGRARQQKSRVVLDGMHGEQGERRGEE